MTTSLDVPVVRWYAAVLVAGTLVACRVHTVDERPPPPLPVPAAFASGATAAPGSGGGERAPDRWWVAFDDAALDGLVERALSGNFQIRAAWARVAQARAGARQLDTTLPEVTATASAGRQHVPVQRTVLPLPDELGGPQTLEAGGTTNSFSASLGAAYELDLWRRLSSSQKALYADASALRDDVESIAMTVASEVSLAWLDVRSLRARRALLGRQLATNDATLDLMQTRFREGLSTALDVFQQRSLVAQTRALVIGADAQLSVQSSRLAVLIGTTSGSVEAVVGGAPDTLPTAPGVPAGGVPADLLDRRPDVRAARRRVVAADFRVATAIADRLPGLRLQGSIGLQAPKLTDLIDGLVWSVLAAITQPLWDNGRRAAAVDQSRAALEERVADYGQALIQAVAEVESALAQEKHQDALLAELATQAELAAATTQAARDRYRDGQVDYLPVLSAVQAEQQIELALLDAQRQRLSLRVQLYRALGGTWTAALPPSRGPR